MAKNEIVVYQPDEQVRLDVQLMNETVWLSILQMVQLFGRERSVIAKHLKTALEEGELDATINVQNLHKNQRGRPHHTLTETDITWFNAQYPMLTVKFSEVFHDRFLILDDREIYLIGASLKDLGRKCFAFTELDPGEIVGLKARL